MNRSSLDYYFSKSSHIYKGNQTFFDSLLFKSSIKANAYLNSELMQGNEIKYQDYFYTYDNSVPIAEQNNFPILNFNEGYSPSDMLGNQILIKEIIAKLYYYFENLPTQDQIENTPKDVPSFFLHYALVYSNAAHDSTNPLRFSDVFQDMTQNGLVYSTPFSFKSASAKEKYKVLLEKTLEMGSFNGSVGSPSLTVAFPCRNSPPFSQYECDFINLWDVLPSEVFESIHSRDVDYQGNQFLFSPGLKSTFQAPDSMEEDVNLATTGSVWFLFQISPTMNSGLSPVYPKLVYYTRTIFTQGKLIQ